MAGAHGTAAGSPEYRRIARDAQAVRRERLATLRRRAAGGDPAALPTLVDAALREAAAAGGDTTAAAPCWARVGAAKLRLLDEPPTPTSTDRVSAPNGTDEPPAAILDEAVLALRTAVADGRHDQRRPMWALLLADAYARRSVLRGGDADDLLRAVDAAATVGNAGELSVDAVVYGAELALRRCRVLTDGGRAEQATVALDLALSLADAAARALDLETAAPRGPTAYRRLIAQVGIETRRARHPGMGRREDLDRMIALARLLTTDPPPDLSGALGAQLGGLLFRRARLSLPDADDAARAVTVLRAVLADPGGPHIHWVAGARFQLAILLHARAQQDTDATALAEAADQARRVAAAPGWSRSASPEALVQLGRLLHDRYAAGDDRPALDDAVRLLGVAWERGAADPAGASGPPEAFAGDATAEQRWPVGWELALAHWARYSVDRRPTDLDRAWAVLVEIMPLLPTESDEAAFVKIWATRLWAERADRGHGGAPAVPAPLTSAELDRYLRSMRAALGALPRTAPDAGLPWRLHQLQDPDQIRSYADTLIARWRQLPVGSPERRRTGGLLARMQMGAAWTGRQSLQWPEIVALLRDALREQSLDPHERGGLAVLLAAALSNQALHHDHAAVAEALDVLERVADDESIDPALRAELEVAIGSVIGLRHELRGVEADATTAECRLQRLLDDPRLGERDRLLMRVEHASLVSRRAARHRDAATMRGCVDTLRECLDAMADNDAARYLVQHHYSIALVIRVSLEGLAAAEDDEDLAAAARAAVAATEVPGQARYDRVFMLGNAGILLSSIAMLRQDVPAITEGVSYLDDALRLCAADDANRPRLLAALGVGCCARYEAGAGRRADIDRAVTALEEALRLTAGPGHHAWATTAHALAHAYRLRDDRRSADREAGLALGLRSLGGHAWFVLLQSGTGRTARSAAEASVEAALDVAGWAIADGRPGDAVRALDACRGLVLHAATVGAGLAEQLTAAGHHDLAVQWRQRDGHASTDPTDSVPDDLRYRVLQALTAGDAQRSGIGASLLDTPREQDIRAALARGGVDALVYLVPANEHTPGCAVLIPGRGAAAIVGLHRLSLHAGVLQEFVSARQALRESGRDLKPAGPRPDPAGGLGPLCDWAWHAAMDEILRRFRRPGHRPRLVLIPMGPLGLVPWHAARVRTPDGGHRYAVQEAVISYAPSARLLCDVLGRSAVPLTGASLVVGDPTGDLTHAGEEAAAIRDTFYRGTFMGRHPDGRPCPAGTPAELLSWLDGHTDVGMVHLACHAQVRPTTDDSAVLSLADGELGADRIVGDAGSRRIGTAVLAACTTHISGRGFDEAFTLASAFLVAGARSVVGSLWRVPDDVTSLLMFVLHEHLAAGRAPAAALHAAQLWMLDPRRAPTPSMPAAMRARVGRVRGDDLAGWAGFIHLGQ